MLIVHTSIGMFKVNNMSDSFQYDIRGLCLVISNKSVLPKWIIHEWMLFIHFMVLAPLNQLVVKSLSSYYVYDTSQICLC